MKYILTVSVLAVFTVLTFSSCKKNWTCYCTTTTSFNDSVLTTGTSTNEFRGTKGDARNNCNNSTQTQSVLGFQVKVESDCALQ